MCQADICHLCKDVIFFCVALNRMQNLKTFGKPPLVQKYGTKGCAHCSLGPIIERLQHYLTILNINCLPCVCTYLAC